MFEQLFNSPLLYSLSLTLVHFLWQGLLVALILKSALFIIDKNKPKLRYALSTVAMISNAVLALFTFAIIYSDKNSILTNSISPIPLTSLVNELTQQNTLLSYQELLPSILAYSLPYLTFSWLTIVIILSSKLLIEVRNVNHLPMHSCVSPSSALLSRFEALAKQIRLTKTPKLLISLKADVPMAIGWLKPVVLLPAGMVTGLNSAQLEMLILHELAHIRRHDYLVNFLQTVVELIFFFHPCVHWIGKQMRNEREYCSDDIAVQHCGDAIAYAHTLTDTASLCANGHFHTIPTMAMAASGGDLKARVLRLVDHHCAPSNHTSKSLAAISLLLGLTILCINQIITTPFTQQFNNHLPWQESMSNSVKTSNTFSQSNRYIEEVNNQNELTNNSIANQLLTRDDTSNDEINKESPITTNEGQEEFASSSAVIEPYFISKKLNNTVIAFEQPIISKTVTSQKSITKNVKVMKIAPTTVAKSSHGQAKNIELKEVNKNKIDIVKKTSISVPVEVAAITNTPSSVQDNLAALTERKNSYKQSSKPLPLNIDKSLLKETSGYQRLSYSNEIKELAVQNDLYAASLAVNSMNNVVKSMNFAIPKQESANTLSTNKPQLLKSISPVYPSLAKRRGIEMEVKVNFTIDRNGNVKDIQFSEHNKLSYFKSAVRSAMRKWRFSPATINNNNVESKMSKIFSFSLHT